MFHSFPNDQRGITLIEVIIAMAIISICILGLLAMQPQSWKMVAKADYLNRAAGILNDELEKAELSILNPEYDPTSVVQSERPVSVGNLNYSVQTTIDGSGSLFYSVTVHVKWLGNSSGISGCRRITRQEPFR